VTRRGQRPAILITAQRALQQARRPAEPRSAVRILGIDPGSQITGYGIVDYVGGKAEPVKWGTIQTSGDHAERLRDIFFAMAEVVREYRPAEIAIERVFLHRNADSALKLGQARAAAICATFEAALPVFEYTPRHIKKAVVGNGGAEKAQVQRMVGMMLGVREALPADAADALAAAICHAHERGTRALLE
jgi:crossover junction endodeoxyribonuclease RuvC